MLRLTLTFSAWYSTASTVTQAVFTSDPRMKTMKTITYLSKEPCHTTHAAEKVVDVYGSDCDLVRILSDDKKTSKREAHFRWIGGHLLETTVCSQSSRADWKILRLFNTYGAVDCWDWPSGLTVNHHILEHIHLAQGMECFQKAMITGVWTRNDAMILGHWR